MPLFAKLLFRDRLEASISLLAATQEQAPRRSLPMPADADGDEPAPRSAPTKAQPDRSFSNKSPKAPRPRLTTMLSKHRLSVQSLSAGSGSSGWLPGVASEAALKAFEKERRRRSIALRLADAETNYDALFARREREQVLSSLSRDALEQGVQKVNEKTQRSNRFLIMPDSGFMQGLDVATMLALLFTAVVSPYEIAFIPDSTSVSLAVANYFVMIVFAVGLVCSFFVPYREPLWNGGGLVRDRRRIAERYLQTWFFFDLISTLPLDAMFSGDSGGDGEDSNTALRAVRGARLVRLIRLFRLIKLGRLLRAQRIISRITARLEKNSELFNISFTIRTACFWMVVVLMVIHWFCCSWGILALIQETQRTEELIEALSDQCRALVLQIANSSNYHMSSCLVPCEIETLATLTGVRKEYLTNEEPWICRRISEGQFTGGSAVAMYVHLLHGEGLLKNPGGKTGKIEENVLFFILSYLMLVLKTLFIGTISGAFANAKPLTKAWQARMDHLNLFLKEMNAPTDLRTRTRQYLRNTQNLELKRSFSGLYEKFSKQLAGEMMSHMSISVVRGVYFFAGCEAEYIRDLASKMVYEAFDRGEKLYHAGPVLQMIVQGTLVRGGVPYGVGQCIGEDVLLQSDALRDRRIAVALTFLEICCLTKKSIEENVVNFPKAARCLRYEGFKIAIYRSTQLLAQYVANLGSEAVPEDQPVGKRRETVVGDALKNLGDEVSEERKEVHEFIHSINGQKKLRGLAEEQSRSTDINMATKAQEALALAEDTDRARHVVIDEDGETIDDKLPMPTKGLNEVRAGVNARQEHNTMADALQAELKDMREEQKKAMQGLQKQMTFLMSIVRKDHPASRHLKQKVKPEHAAAVAPTAAMACRPPSSKQPIESSAPAVKNDNGDAQRHAATGSNHTRAVPTGIKADQLLQA